MRDLSRIIKFCTNLDTGHANEAFFYNIYIAM